MFSSIWNHNYKNIKKYQTGITTFSLIGLIVFGLLVYTVPFVDDIPSYIAVDNSYALPSDFSDTDSELDAIVDDVFLIAPGEGLKHFSAEVPLYDKDELHISFQCDNKSLTPCILYVDLFSGPDFDSEKMQIAFTLLPGIMSYDNNITVFLMKGDPSSALLRLFTFDNTDLELSNLIVERRSLAYQPRTIISVTTTIAGIAFLICLFLFLWNVRLKIHEMRHAIRKIRSNISVLRRIKWKPLLSVFLSVIIIVLVTMLIIYRNADIRYPLSYSGGDEMGVYYFGKLIDEYGITLTGHRTGGFSGADLYDYPYSDSLSFLLVKIIGFFTDNPFLIINTFYFLCFFLAGLFCAAAMLHLGISPFVTVVLSSLYAFTPYIQIRYSHMWLVTFFMIPIGLTVAVEIAKGTVYFERGNPNNNRRYFRIIFSSFCCAFTGLYYAYFTCAMFSAAIVINIVNNRKKKAHMWYPLTCIAAVLVGVIGQIIPNLLYQSIHGINSGSEVLLRGRGDSEIYGLKLVQLLMPRPSHRIALFSKLAQKYSSMYPLVNENMTASLGIIASIGFVTSILILLSTSSAAKEISYLNFSAFFIGTIGGLGSLLSLILPAMIRCYNRISVVIMFLSLVQIGYLIDKFRSKLPSSVFSVFLSVILLVGLYDQTATFVNPDFSTIDSDIMVVKEIEHNMPADSMIFQIPCLNWPSWGGYSSFLGYVNSDTLRWSFGAAQNRVESDWQQYVSHLSDEERMVDTLLEAGYSGIYFNKNLYSSFCGGDDQTQAKIEQLNSVLGEPTVVSENGNICFWSLI